MRKKHSAQFKTKVALDAIREIKTMGELSSQHEVHRVQIQSWKKQAMTALPDIFTSKKDGSQVEKQAKLIEELYKQVGQLKVENDWLKKKYDDLSN